jgi:hypothetical protein
VSLLRKVEQGSVPASPAFTSAVARALGIRVAELLGQPYLRETAADHRVFAAIPALRRELIAYSVTPGDGIWPHPMPQLADAVAAASQLRHRVASHDGSERERVFGLLAEAYYAAG